VLCHLNNHTKAFYEQLRLELFSNLRCHGDRGEREIITHETYEVTAHYNHVIFYHLRTLTAILIL